MASLCWGEHKAATTLLLCSSSGHQPWAHSSALSGAPLGPALEACVAPMGPRAPSGPACPYSAGLEGANKAKVSKAAWVPWCLHPPLHSRAEGQGPRHRSAPPPTKATNTPTKLPTRERPRLDVLPTAAALTGPLTRPWTYPLRAETSP